uniref:Transmembrane protein 120A n=1 Tax=Amazona collaria TaxID=241587 RepID=A0A8B9GFK3_9PSIT
MSAMAGSAAECLREWEELQDGFQRIQDNHKLYKQKLEELTKLQDGISSSIARQKKRLKELALSFKKCKAHASPEQQETIQETQSLIKERQNVFFEMEAYLPKKNGLYLSLVLGNVNVTLLSKQAKFAYKDEYEKFKLYLTIILLIISSSCRFLVNTRVTDAVFNFLLVWYYCTLTIRESILINNGSKIKGWWVFHHYISTFLSGVMLTWPDGLMYQMFRNQFLSFSMYQSFVQFLQYYYQSGCLYRLRALGERHNMDLTVVLAALQCSHPLPDAPAPRMQGVAGPHLRPPLPHPLPGQLLHHPPGRAPEVQEQEQGHEAGLKGGSVGARTVSPHQLHLPSPYLLDAVRTLVSHPVPWGWDVNRPCVLCGAGSVSLSLPWSWEHPAPPAPSAFTCRGVACLGMLVPPLCPEDSCWSLGSSPAL